MKERLLTLGLAVAALALFWALIFPKPQPAGPELTRPLAGDSGSAGYLGLVRWLAAERVPVVAWHARYGRLVEPRALPSAAGNVLITTMPHPVPVRAAEQGSLDAWLSRGNTLIVMAALADTPRWSAALEDGFLAELKRLTRVDFTQLEAPEESGAGAARTELKEMLAPADVPLRPIGTHPLLEHVATIATTSDLPGTRWRTKPMDTAPLLALARRSDTGDEALWVKPQGRGRVVICAFASPLSNHDLGRAGNARLLSNIVASAVGADGEVLIDDAHQGATDEYDPKAFYRDPRLYRTLGWLVALWFVWVLGSVPLRGATPDARRRDDTAFLTTSAAFFANALRPATVAVRLLEHFFNSIRARLGLREDGAPVWDWLAAHARISAAELDELRRLHARAVSGRRVDLAKLNVLLNGLSGKLT